MKEVFKVTDLKASQGIAMAKLKKEAGRESTESFLREARLTAYIYNTRISSPSMIWALMKMIRLTSLWNFLDGKSLHEIIKEKSLNQNQLLDVFNKVCDAVAYAHSRQIIHLDLNRTIFRSENTERSTYVIGDWQKY